MVGVLPVDVNVTLVAHMLSRRLDEVNATSDTTQGVGVTHSTAEEFWSVMFLVVVLVLALCMICACCGIFAQLLGCGSFLTKTLLSGFSTVARLCTSCCSGNSTTPKARAPTAPPLGGVKVAQQHHGDSHATRRQPPRPRIGRCFCAHCARIVRPLRDQGATMEPPWSHNGSNMEPTRSHN